MRTFTRPLTVFALLALLALLSTSGLVGCGKEVCKDGLGPRAEVTVSFKGFTLSQAVTLEIDSLVKGPQVEAAPHRYHSRRVGRMAFPDSARNGTATFVFDPGSYIMGLRLEKASFDMTTWLRVYDGAGLLLAEGRYHLSGHTNQCWLNQKMTVSGSQTCNHKVEGDACASRGGEPYVCRAVDEQLTCQASVCGDGFIDMQNGEMCDPASDASHPCSDACLPPLLETTLWQGKLDRDKDWYDWYAVDVQTGPSPRYMAAGATHFESKTFVLFGGQDAALQPSDDTWLFDGETWTAHSGVPRPSARYGHAMAYDPAREVIVLFGGTDDASTTPQARTFMDDLHVFHPDTGWESITPLGDPPPARFRAAMAYQPGVGGAPAGFVLYGGRQEGTTDARATYLLSWEPAQATYTWTRYAAPGSVTNNPAATYSHTMTWIPDLGEIWMVGGQTSDATTGGNAARTLWRFTLENPGTDGVKAWEAVTGADTPDNITRHQAVAGPSFAQLLLVGGSPNPPENASTTRYLGMWRRTASGWEQMLSFNVPPQRTGHVAFYLPGPDEDADPGQGRVFTFGGQGRLDHGADAPTVLGGDLWFYSDTANPETFIARSATLKVSASGSTNLRGFYSLATGDLSRAPLDGIAPLYLADLDGDGQEEIAVGLPVHRDGSDPNTRTFGTVFVHDPFNSERNLDADKALLTVGAPTKAIESPLGSWLGSALATGDLNGDGAADLVMGAPLRKSTNPAAFPDSGAVYVVFGGNARHIPVAGGTTKITLGANPDSARHRTIHGETGSLPRDLHEDDPDGDRFGYALAVGDFDGDGLADIAVGAPLRRYGDDATEAVAVNAGAVYILSGAHADSWPQGGSTVPVNNLSPAPLVFRSTTEGLHLGVSLAVGDVNGDGIADLVVGTGTSSSSTDCIPPACGAVAILYGKRGLFGAGGRELTLESLGSSDGVVATAPGGVSDPLFGMGGVVTVVDLDFDGRGEVVAALGRPDQRSGGPFGVALLRGMGLVSSLAQNRDASSTTHLVIRAPSSNRSAGFGAFLAPGDVNGDRRLDLLIGAPFEPLWRNDLPTPAPSRAMLPNAGALYVVLGSRLARYWDPYGDGRQVLELDDVQDWTDADAVTVPVLRVRGGLTQGFFGASAVTGSHIAQLEPLPPYSQTMVFQPGWFGGSGESTAFNHFQGRLHALDLHRLLEGELP